MIPQAQEIESAVLGLALKSEQACVTMVSLLSVEDFTERYQTIFSAIQTLFGESAPVNAATVKNYLEEKQLTQEVGPDITDHLLKDAKGVKVEGINVACEYLKRYTTRRKLIDLCWDYNQKAQDRDEDTEQLLASAGSEFFNLLSTDTDDKETDHTEAVEQTIHELQNPIQGGIMSELDLDKITMGFKPKQFVVLAGKTSHGKSALAHNLMLTAGMKYGHVTFVSMEMSRSEIMERIFSMYCGIDYGKIRERSFSKNELNTILKNKDRLLNTEYGYTIIDEGSVTVDKLYATARRLKMQKDTKMLIVDYLQQVASKGNTREQEVANVTKNLKRIAMDLNIVVVGLSQFNREAIGRPQLRQLRESGAIENDANTAILLWNPMADGKEKFDQAQSEGKWAGASTKNIIELHVAKNRGGKTGTVKVGFDGNYQRFYNLAPEPKSAFDYF